MTRMPKQYNDDDGRVICDMDVDGMSWHDKRVRREIRASRKAKSHEGPKMTKSEARRFTWYAVSAGLLIVLVFAVTWVLFTLFATQIWFR